MPVVQFYSRHGGIWEINDTCNSLKDAPGIISTTSRSCYFREDMFFDLTVCGDTNRKGKIIYYCDFTIPQDVDIEGLLRALNGDFTVPVANYDKCRVKIPSMVAELQVKEKGETMEDVDNVILDKTAKKPNEKVYSDKSIEDLHVTSKAIDVEVKPTAKLVNIYIDEDDDNSCGMFGGILGVFARGG